MKKKRSNPNVFFAIARDEDVPYIREILAHRTLTVSGEGMHGLFQLCSPDPESSAAAIRASYRFQTGDLCLYLLASPHSYDDRMTPEDHAGFRRWTETLFRRRLALESQAADYDWLSRGLRKSPPQD